MLPVSRASIVVVVCFFIQNILQLTFRVSVGSLSRFKLSLPQCNVPGVLNCMSGRLSGFPRLY